jgi:rubredoxin
MVEDKKKVVMIVIVVVCLGLAAVIAKINLGGGSNAPGIPTGPLAMLCVNPDCGHMYEMTKEEQREQMSAKGRDAMRRRRGPRSFICPQCSAESVYQAKKCTKCETVFIPDLGSGDFSDRCPECGYSAIEERRESKG